MTWSFKLDKIFFKRFMLGIFLQVLDIEGCACNRVYNPVTLLTLPHCQHEVTEYKGLKNPKPTTTKTTRKSLPPPPPRPFLHVLVSAAGMCVL